MLSVILGFFLLVSMIEGRQIYKHPKDQTDNVGHVVQHIKEYTDFSVYNPQLNKNRKNIEEKNHLTSITSDSISIHNKSESNKNTKRLRRDIPEMEHNRSSSENSINKEDPVLKRSTPVDEENLPMQASKLIQTLWNPNETKENIRNAQAQLMNMYMDSSVEPCNDFYKYACGNWEKYHPIPKDKSETSHIIVLWERLFMALRELLEGTENHKPIGSNYNSNDAEIKAKILYESCVIKSMKVASKLLRFETQLALSFPQHKSSLSLKSAQYKRLNLSELQVLIPDVNWWQYLTTVQRRNVSDSEEVIMKFSKHMTEFVKLINRTDCETVANYMFWRFATSQINQLDGRFDNVKQNFYRVLKGSEESPRYCKYCVHEIENGMDMVLAAMFVRKYFDENSKNRISALTNEIKEMFRENLKTLEWLDVETKKQAELKLDAMSLLVGYPDYVLSSDKLDEKYMGITVTLDNYFENILQVALHRTQTEQNQLFKPVEKSKWMVAPASVNAYMSRQRNHMGFPAGFLQAPFYNPKFPRTMTLGGMGAIIGHEMTHGFDNHGRQYDYNGNLKDWWSNSSSKAFEEKAQCIIEQYGNYTIANVSVNGETTVGENIADNGGLKLVFQIFKKWMQSSPSSEADEHFRGINVTAEQLFFLSYAHLWCSAYRQEYAVDFVNTKPHAPKQYRVTGVFSNMNEFSEAFNCPLGSPMNPLHKCNVW